MSIGSFLLGLALAILVVPFVISPFLKDSRRKRQALPEDDPLAGTGGAAPVRAQHDALVALRDLDFDFRTGKITEEDYAPLRQRLVADAAQALRAAEAPDLNRDAEIEAAVRAVRAARGTVRPSLCPHCNAPLAADSKFCPQCGEMLATTCPKCQSSIQATDKFCVHCGASLKGEAALVS